MGWKHIPNLNKEFEDEEWEPVCEICGSTKCDYFYYDKDDQFLGCDDCIKRKDVWDA